MRFLLSSPAVSQLPFEGELYYSDIVSSTSLLIMEWPRGDLRDHPVPTTMPRTGTLSVSLSKLLINLLTCISTKKQPQGTFTVTSQQVKQLEAITSSILSAQTSFQPLQPSIWPQLANVCAAGAGARSHRTLKVCCILSPELCDQIFHHSSYSDLSHVI